MRFNRFTNNLSRLSVVMFMARCLWMTVHY